MINKAKEKEVYDEIDKSILNSYVRPLINEKIIEEHRLKPIGHHSDELERVLRYLRRHHEDLKGKDLIICTKPHKEWVLGENTGIRGEKPIIFENEKFDSREAAEHGLFLKRLKKYGLLKTDTSE